MIRIDTEELLKLKNYYLIGGTSAVNSSSSSKESGETDTSLSLEDALRILPKDPKKLIELFNLDDPNNRYILLRLLGRDYLEKLTEELDKSSMLLIMQFFTVAKLMSMLQKLPKMKLLEMLQQIFTPEEMLKMMPEKYMDKFLTNDGLKKEELLKSLMGLPPEALSKMIQSVTGKPPQNVNPSMSKDEQSAAMVLELSQMNPQNFKKALVSMEKEEKMQVILELTEKDKDKWQLFPQEAFLSTVEMLPKDMMIQSMYALETSDMAEMINILPDEMLTQSLTLVQPEVFAESLLENNTDLLAQLLTAA